MRIMGVDFGEKRIGVAISDPTCTIAQPLCTIEREGVSDSEVARRIAEIAERLDVGTIVVGFTVSTGGKETVVTRRIRNFARKLMGQTRANVVLWSELYTTNIAERTLAEAGTPKWERKGLVDRISASLILESFLESQRGRR